LLFCSDPLASSFGHFRPSRCVVEMLRSLTTLAYLAVLATKCDAEGPGAQLRGSGAASAAATGLPSLEHTDCGCSQSEGCACTRSGSSAEPELQTQSAAEEALLNHTQALSAWWQKQGELARQLECSCTLGVEGCACGAAAGNESSTDAGSGESRGLELEALRNETEQSLSLGWVGGGYYHHGWGRGPWGRPGFRCGRAGWGGCGCRWHGCRCGHAGFGGCGWR
jgi:hypothetical protein